MVDYKMSKRPKIERKGWCVLIYSFDHLALRRFLHLSPLRSDSLKSGTAVREQPEVVNIITP